MTINPDTKKNLTVAAVFLLPLVLVKISTLFIGGPGPLHARASSQGQTAPNPIGEVTPPPAWTQRQLAAAQQIRALRERPFGSSPMLHDMSTAIASQLIKSPTDTSSPNFILQAVMSTSTGDKALIDGYIYRRGDQIRNSAFVVATIDAENHTVTLADAQTNQTMTIRVEIPRADTGLRRPDGED